MSQRNTDVSTWAPVREQLLHKARTRLQALERRVGQGGVVHVAKLESARNLVLYLEERLVR